MTAGNGLPCVKCGTAAWNKNGACKQCGKDYLRKWIADNPDKMKQTYHRRYLRRRQGVLEQSAQWRRDNPEKRKEITRRWREANKEQIKASSRIYSQNNKEKVNARTQRRRTQKTLAGGSYTPAEWKELCQQYENKCLYPGCERTDLQADHVTPVVKGGSSDISNIQPLCTLHNQQKADKVIDYRYKPGLEHWQQSRLF